MSFPSMKIFPLSWECSFVIHLNVVVLPAPFTPNKPKHSPYSKQNDKLRTAFTSEELQHPSSSFL